MPKPKPKKRTARTKRKSLNPLRIRRDLILPIAAAIAAVIAALVFFLGAPDKRVVVKTPPPVKPYAKVHNAPSHTPKPDASVKYAPKPDIPKPETKAPVVPDTGDDRPRIAIVIDDMGGDMAALNKLKSFPVPMNIAVLPYQPYSRRTAEEARDAGLDVLLHLPMQADAKFSGLGDGALFTDMGSSEILQTLDGDLTEVPGAVGVNNHMGSAFTADKAAMSFVLSDLKAKGLFFLDSRTTAETVAESTAREMGVPTAARRVFLDDSNEIEDVRFQFARLVKLAKKDGYAIAIGHPRPATLQVLGEELPKLDGSGVRVVRVSTLVN